MERSIFSYRNAPKLSSFCDRKIAGSVWTVLYSRGKAGKLVVVGYDLTEVSRAALLYGTVIHLTAIAGNRLPVRPE